MRRQARQNHRRFALQASTALQTARFFFVHRRKQCLTQPNPQTSRICAHHHNVYMHG